MEVDEVAGREQLHARAHVARDQHLDLLTHEAVQLELRHERRAVDSQAHVQPASDPMDAERTGATATPMLPAMPWRPKALPFSRMLWEMSVLAAG